ncbi:MAG TPA: 30S ribosomal protein S15 [Gammaproteobacteria bacterium]|nr:30S ribosomal protein S15 [Gammaproteobacteria bacterium]
MTLSAHEKSAIVKDFQRKTSDTGSSEVQIALFTKRIEQITEHCKIFRKDNHSRKGLVNLVNKRRALLNYMKSTSVESYQKLIKQLGLRK